MTALKRGIEFGIIKMRRGHYLISKPEENFTKLQLPTSGKVRVSKIREHPKLLDKVMKRSPIMKTRRGKYGRGMRNRYMSNMAASSSMLYNSD
jgi:hypothetical protein